MKMLNEEQQRIIGDWLYTEGWYSQAYYVQLCRSMDEALGYIFIHTGMDAKKTENKLYSLLSKVDNIYKHERQTKTYAR